MSLMPGKIVKLIVKRCCSVSDRPSKLSLRPNTSHIKAEFPNSWRIRPRSYSLVSKNDFLNKKANKFGEWESFKSSYPLHCVKSVCIRIYSGRPFPAFGLNTERYSVSLFIQSECGKKRTRITPNTDTFYAVLTTRF